jgi:hypothetical protein
MSLGTPAAARPPLLAATAPAQDPGLAEATRLYEQGIAERERGDFVAAAEAFTGAYAKVPADAPEIRAAVLFDLVDARRNAFAEGEGPAQLCECERLLVAYLDELRARLGAKGDRLPDARKARKLLAEVRAQLAGLARETPGLDCAALTPGRAEAPPPAPAPDPAPPERPPGPDVDPGAQRRARALRIAGAALTGVGVGGFGLMIGGLVVGRRAERDGDELTRAAQAAGAPLSEDDPALQAVVRRGERGNALAIAGGAIGAAAAVTGVALLVVGLRRERAAAARASLTPALAPGLAGASLRVQF